MTEPPGGVGVRKRKLPPATGTPELDRTEEETRIKAAKLGEKAEAVADLDLLERPATPAPEVVDGKLRIMYLDAGQGDSTLITTPAGKHIMIDCGSATKSPNVALTGDKNKDRPLTTRANKARGQAISDAVTGAGFLNGGTHLDILILTHGDLDHDNQVSTALKGITVGAVYHRGTFGNYQGNTRKHISTMVAENAGDPNAEDPIKQVFCCWKDPADTTQGVDVRLQFNRREPAYGEEAKKENVIDILTPAAKPDRLIVWRETNCTVTIVAGNVQPGSISEQDVDKVTISDGRGIGEDDRKNTESIVTLVEAFGKKFLFCGDATRSTEAFLVKQHSARIAGVDCLTVAHHGSSGTSSTPAFIAAARPASVVISSGRQYSQYQHPRWAAARRYLRDFDTRLVAAAGAFPLICWVGKTKTEQEVAPPAVDAALAVTAVSQVETRKGGCWQATVAQPIHVTPHTIVEPPG